MEEEAEERVRDTKPEKTRPRAAGLEDRGGPPARKGCGLQNLEKPQPRSGLSPRVLLGNTAQLTP